MVVSWMAPHSSIPQLAWRKHKQGSTLVRKEEKYIKDSMKILWLYFGNLPLNLCQKQSKREDGNSHLWIPYYFFLGYRYNSKFKAQQLEAGSHMGQRNATMAVKQQS